MKAGALKQVVGQRIVPRHHVIQVHLEHWLVEAYCLPQPVSIHKRLSVAEGAHELAVLGAHGRWRLRNPLLSVAALLVRVEDATLVEVHLRGKCIYEFKGNLGGEQNNTRNQYM